MLLYFQHLDKLYKKLSVGVALFEHFGLNYYADANENY